MQLFERCCSVVQYKSDHVFEYILEYFGFGVNNNDYCDKKCEHPSIAINGIESIKGKFKLVNYFNPDNSVRTSTNIQTIISFFTK